MLGAKLVQLQSGQSEDRDEVITVGSIACVFCNSLMFVLHLFARLMMQSRRCLLAGFERVGVEWLGNSARVCPSLPSCKPTRAMQEFVFDRLETTP